jgi:hypothetical protein
MAKLSSMKKVNHSEQKFLSILLFSLFFAFILNYSYVNFIFHAFESSGLILDADNILPVIIQCAGILAMLLLIKKTKKNSVHFLTSLLIFIYIPISTIYSVGGGELEFFLYSIFSFLIIFFALGPNFVFSSNNIRIQYGQELLIGFILIYMTYFVIFKLSGVVDLISKEMFFIEKRRYLYTDFYNLFDVYLLNWMYSAILPLLLWLSLHKKKFLYSLVLILLILSSFFVTYKKEYIFILSCVIFLYYAQSHKWLYYFLGFLVLILMLFFGDELFIKYFVNRQFISIGKNQYLYYDFINENSFIWFSNTFLSSFLDYPYTDTLPKIIGSQRYVSEFNNRSNSGFLGAAYSQGGVIMIMIYSALIGLIYKKYLMLDIRYNANSHILFGIILTFKLSNNDLLTSLLSGGIAVLFIVLIILGKRFYRI